MRWRTRGGACGPWGGCPGAFGAGPRAGSGRGRTWGGSRRPARTGCSWGRPWPAATIRPPRCARSSECGELEGAGVNAECGVRSAEWQGGDREDHAQVSIPELVERAVDGRFGPYGGRYVPGTLMAALGELARAHEDAKTPPPFWGAP